MTAAAAHQSGYWREQAERAKSRLATYAEDNKEQIRAATDTVEVFAAAGIIGYLHGRKGAVPKVLGVPYDLGLAGVFKLAAFMGWGGKWSADLHSLGNGFGAYYFGSVGAEMGQRALRAAKDKDGKPVALNRPLTDTEAKDRNVDVRTIVAGPSARRFLVQPANGMQSHAPMQSSAGWL